MAVRHGTIQPVIEVRAGASGRSPEVHDLAGLQARGQVGVMPQVTDLTANLDSQRHLLDLILYL